MKNGFTLVETLIAVAIFAAVMIAVASFAADSFSYNGSISNSFQTSQSAQLILKTMLAELRETAPASNGAYPIAYAGSTTISFYADANNNGSVEQIGYTLIGTNLYRTVIHPTGSPAAYLLANQSTTTLMSSVRNGASLPLFQYYDANYSGTSTPLSQPVTTTAVRLVKVNVMLDVDPNRAPSTVTYTVQAGIRNLKTNL